MKNLMNRLLFKPIPIICLLMAIVLSVSCNRDKEEMKMQTIIVASFESEVIESNALAYKFINNSLLDGSNDGDFTSSWDFGGDGTSTEKNPTHTFSSPGTYEVSLTVEASDGELATATNTIVVELSLSTPNAAFTANQEFNEDLTFSFTNTSEVTGTSETSFTSLWDFGGDGTSTAQSPTHNFSAAGFYEVTLTVTAADGEVDTATETIEVKAIKNKYASITDTYDDDAGELRLSLDSIQNGRVSYIYRVKEGPVDKNILDAFINVAGTSTTGRNSIVEIRFKDDAPHEFREGASDATIAAANFPEGVADQWIPVSVSWTSDGVNTPRYTIEIDGQMVITDAPSTTRDLNDATMVADHLATVIHGARNFLWKYTAITFTNDAVLHVDDIVVYSSDSGTEMVVFEDNFEGWPVGEILAPWFNTNSPYHANTIDATVGADW